MAPAAAAAAAAAEAAAPLTARKQRLSPGLRSYSARAGKAAGRGYLLRGPPCVLNSPIARCFKAVRRARLVRSPSGCSFDSRTMCASLQQRQQVVVEGTEGPSKDAARACVLLCLPDAACRAVQGTIRGGALPAARPASDLAIYPIFPLTRCMLRCTRQGAPRWHPRGSTGLGAACAAALCSAALRLDSRLPLLQAGASAAR